jgi:hypothetical protein
VPSGICFDLATWHLINTVHAPARLAEICSMCTLQQRLGHALAATLNAPLAAAIEADLERIVQAAQETVRRRLKHRVSGADAAASCRPVAPRDAGAAPVQPPAAAG